MLLKSIELFGFKSFAGRQKISFNASITALLGPNGCGKSNIIDAIKWVMGEQSPKALRCEKMTDLIFGGTQTKKEQNMAEVTLTLENNRGVLPLEYSVIEIRRRIFRDGENRYFLNGVTVRLKEIRDLFYDSGLSKSLYSIIEQGKIDQALSIKDDERRLLFEEAAGLSRHKVQSAEAALRLEKTELNIEQLENILFEIKTQYDRLKLESVAALRYKTAKESLTTITKEHLASIYNEKREQLIIKKKMQGQLHDEITQILKHRDEYVGRQQQQHQLLEQHQNSLQSYRKELFALEIEQKNRLEEKVDLTDLLHEAEQLAKSATERLSNAHHECANVQTKADDELAQVKKLKERLSFTHSQLATLKKMIDLSKEELTHQTAQHQQSSAELTATVSQLAELDAHLQEQTNAIVGHIELKLSTAPPRLERELMVSNIEEALSMALLIGNDLATDLTVTSIKPVNLLAKHKQLLGHLAKLEAQWPAYYQYSKGWDELLAQGSLITAKQQLDDQKEQLSRLMVAKKMAIEGIELATNRLNEAIRLDEQKHHTLKIDEARFVAELDAAEVALKKDDELLALLRSRVVLLEKDGQDRQDELAKRRLKLTDCNNKYEEAVKKYQELQKLAEKLSKELEFFQDGLKASTEQQRLSMSQLDEKERSHQRLCLELEALELMLKREEEAFWQDYLADIKGFIRDETFDDASYLTAVERLKNELALLGEVNLLSIEAFSEVQQRFEFLTDQLNDLKKAKLDLKALTVTMHHEAEQQFLVAFRAIAANFKIMFTKLFEGGQATLALSNEQDALGCSIEIMVQPPGKKNEHIASLSGGERSLGGVALLFAIYLLKPSPFCLFDEIDAAMDEHNVGRLGVLLKEFEQKAQFIIITHNKKTASIASSLLGVTMQEAGISRAVVLKMEER